MPAAEIAEYFPASQAKFARNARKVQRAVLEADDRRAKDMNDAQFAAHRADIQARYPKHSNPAMTKLNQIDDERRARAAARAALPGGGAPA